MYLNNKRSQQGSILVIILVIIIVLLALGLALTKVLSASAQQNAIEYYGARAYLAAHTGIERGLSELFPLNSTAQTCAAVTNNPVVQTEYLNNCTIKVSCGEHLNVPDSSTSSGAVNIYYLQSSATCAANNCPVGASCRKDYWQTQRTLSVEAKTLP